MIRTETSGPVVTFILDAPERKNAFDEVMLRDLTAGLRSANADSDCRCIVVTGADNTFCAGRNLSDTSVTELGLVLERESLWEDVLQTLHRSMKPSVAVVEGHAVAGGFTLAMGCDYVLADEHAVFGAFEMQHGFPASVCTPLLAKLVPPRLALEWAMLGQPIPARRLFEHGLINRLVDGTDELMAAAETFVAGITDLEPDAVALTLELHRAARNMPLVDALAMGKQQNALLASSGVLNRAMERFAEKRAKKETG